MLRKRNSNFLKLISLSLVAVVSLSLTACESSGHTHSFVEEASYAHHKETLASEAIFYKSCSACGENSQEIFSVQIAERELYASTSPTLTLYQTEGALSYGLTYNTVAKCLQPQIAIKETSQAEWVFYDAVVEESTLCDFDDNPTFYVNKAVMELTPDVSYDYKIVERIVGVESETYTFTAIDPSDEEFTFASFGDSQNSWEDGAYWGKILSQVSGEVDFYVHPGDIVNDSKEEEHFLSMIDVNKKYFATVPMMMTPGNHCVMRDNVMFEHFNYNLPSQESMKKGFYYSFTYGDVKFISLNTADITGSGIKKEQYDWLINELENNTAKWTIVYTHRPLYAAGHYKNNAFTFALREQLNDVFAEYGVDVVLSGHEHIVMKTFPIGKGSAVNKCDTTVLSTTNSLGENVEVKYDVNPTSPIYVSCGPTGNKLYADEIDSDMEFFEFAMQGKKFSWAEFSVTKDKLTVSLKCLADDSVEEYLTWGIIKDEK